MVESILDKANQFFKSKDWLMHSFQNRCLKEVIAQKNGLLTAPTGSGKTLALALPHIVKSGIENNQKLSMIWISPLRSLSKDLCDNINDASFDLKVPFRAAIRNGDTPQKERVALKKSPPQCLITTPETLHLLLAQKKNKTYFKHVQMLVVDEWHELLGSKRGVQTLLALSQIRHLSSNAVTWGISATIGNTDEAKNVLLYGLKNIVHIKAGLKKKLNYQTLLPDSINEYPWSGHLGIKLLEKTIPVLEKSKSTLVFTNTRSQTEIWYQNILLAKPEWAGMMAMHHGSLARDTRSWVEDSLHRGTLKLVVCTSSLDLGVDFAPVETVIQIGSPKGVSRILQRAGRSGHRPGEASNLYFLPTNSLELIESSALQLAIKHQSMENQKPYEASIDVLVQFLITLAVGDGFNEQELFKRILNVYTFRFINRDQWEWVLSFIVHGGQSLTSYDEFHKVVVEDNLYKVISRRVAMRHRFSIGTIEGDVNLRIKLTSGKYIGTVESYFITRLKIGDVFYFAGKTLEFVSLEGNTVRARKSNAKKAIVVSWQGSRMSLSGKVSYWLKHILNNYKKYQFKEMAKVEPLLDIQRNLSSLPFTNGLLIEMMQSKEGYHLFCYPIAGRSLHEGLAMLTAYRLSRYKNFTCSIAMNDYGFELLSDEPIPIEDALEEDLFSKKNLLDDLHEANNFNQMSEKRFTNIASIAGLLYKGRPNELVKSSHLSTHAKLFYKVFDTYEPDNLLLQQAQNEVIFNQLEHKRLMNLFDDISNEGVDLKYIDRPTPFCFPILVDRLRETLTTERIEERIKKMLKEI
jgi:ATP-dependent Lhr-like helicase